MEAVVLTRSAIITQCAWCGNVKVAGSYKALGIKGLIQEIDLPAEWGTTIHYAVSHGICDPCKDRMAVYSLAA